MSAHLLAQEVLERSESFFSGLDLGDVVGVLMGAGVALVATWRTERWTRQREAHAERAAERRRRLDEATDVLAAINSMTWDVISTPAPDFLTHPDKLEAIQARWASIRPVLFRIVVTYDSETIRDNALSLVTELTTFFALAGIKMSDPDTEKDEFERELNDRRQVRRRVDVLAHALLLRIRQELEEERDTA